MNLKEHAISVLEIIKAEKIVRKYLKETNLTHYQSLSELVGAKVFIKHENHNPGGSFKIRGGVNLLHHVRANKIAGVITFTTGNHGISIAMASKIFGIKSTVVVPIGNNPKKNTMIIEAGARLIEAGKNFDEASEIVREISEKEDLYFVHAANEPHLINGVGTEFLEILRDMPEIDVIILPIGAGSELAAAVTVFKALKPTVEIYAVQSEISKAAYLSWKANKIEVSENKTFAGGFATGTGYELPLSIYGGALKDFILLSEAEINEGMSQAVKHTGNLAEGAGSSTIMAMLKIKERLVGKNVVLQMSGGNIENNKFKESIAKFL